MQRGNEVVPVKDFLVHLYERNGYEIVSDEPKAEPEKVEPKKSTRKRTAKK